LLVTTVEVTTTRLRQDLDEQRNDLLEVSHRIHDHPELGYEEFFAHDELTDYLAEAGLEVRRGAYGHATAFEAVAGSGGPHVAVLCEYDALPGIGHGCGHNVIAAAGVGAGVAAARALGDRPGTVHVIGCPAEEYGGGKILLGRRGAFDDIDVAMMVHPGDLDLTRMETLARQEVTATYNGRAAHAASAPHLGVNALDAAVLGYIGVSALRQQMLPTDRVHGIFHEAGIAPNIIPAYSRTEWNVRSLTADRLQVLCERVGAALEAGAAASGCTAELQWGDIPYAEMRDHPELVSRLTSIAELVDRHLVEPADGARVSGSTDMGNVSQHVPSIHPIIQAAPLGTPLHSTEFADAGASEIADLAVVDGALIMAALVGQLIADGDKTTALRCSDIYGRSPWQLEGI